MTPFRPPVCCASTRSRAQMELRENRHFEILLSGFPEGLLKTRGPRCAGARPRAQRGQSYGETLFDKRILASGKGRAADGGGRASFCNELHHFFNCAQASRKG